MGFMSFPRRRETSSWTLWNIRWWFQGSPKRRLTFWGPQGHDAEYRFNCNWSGNFKSSYYLHFSWNSIDHAQGELQMMSKYNINLFQRRDSVEWRTFWLQGLFEGRDENSTGSLIVGDFKRKVITHALSGPAMIDLLWILLRLDFNFFSAGLFWFGDFNR
jgi:hypothetical protein